MCACVCVFVRVYTHTACWYIHRQIVYLTELGGPKTLFCISWENISHVLQKFFSSGFFSPQNVWDGPGAKNLFCGEKNLFCGKTNLFCGKKNLFCTSWDPRHAHVTHINASCHAYACIVSHVWLVHVTRMNAIGHVTNMNASCLAYERVMSHI